MKKKKSLIDFMDYLLKEDNNIPQPQSSYEIRPVEQSKDISLDQVVDRYIVRYEKEAIPTTDSYEGEMFESIKPFGQLLSEVLSEADDEDPAATEDTSETDTAADSGDASGGFGSDLADTTTVGAGGTAKADAHNAVAVINTPQINLQEFAKNVARMINNFETLLNPKDIILNRVENYILTNYDQRTAEEFMNILDTNYSLKTPEKRDENENDFPTPYAAGALSTEG
jgi:hypothetical protein